jgi:hypothetical protein
MVLWKLHVLMQSLQRTLPKSYFIMFSKHIKEDGMSFCYCNIYNFK